MANHKNKFNSLEKYFINLAFEKAKINLGSTGTNPSVGCIVERNGSVLSSGYTSLKGRPHAEFNALNKKINFKNANLYTTLEPCSHYGKTKPCTNIIRKKNIKNIYFSVYDEDPRSKKKSIDNLKIHKIKVNELIEKQKGSNFYESYLLKHSDKYPLVDAKIALSKDNYSINKKNKNITNFKSRQRAQFIRSFYDCLISTSKSINRDNSLLNCRIRGLENKSPDVVIIDRKLKIKRTLDLFDIKNRKIIIITESKVSKKINLLKKKGAIVKNIQSINSFDFFKKVLNYLKKKGYSRILSETGLIFLNFLLRYNFLNNLYIFKTSTKLKQYGHNNTTKNYINKIKFKKKYKISVFLDNDILYKVKIKNV